MPAKCRLIAAVFTKAVNSCISDLRWCDCRRTIVRAQTWGCGLLRRTALQYRTIDVAPLDLEAMAPTLSRFRRVDHSAYYVTALAAVALVYLPFGKRLYPRVKMKFDDVLIRAFPSLGRLAW